MLGWSICGGESVCVEDVSCAGGGVLSRDGGVGVLCAMGADRRCGIRVGLSCVVMRY